MFFDINIAIFLGFLAVNLVVGLLSSRGIRTIREYAIGNKNFRTATLVSTIVATWVGGSFFVTLVTETYTQGIAFIAIGPGGFLSLFLVGVLFAPRMAEFLDKLSVAEAMGNLYGNKVRIITAISGFIGGSGIIAIQLKIAGLLFEYALGIPIVYGVILSGIIITLYSSLGGIKSVTFTDVIQFFAFGVVIPTIAYFLFSNIESNQVIVNTLTTNPLFDYHSVFSFSNPKIYYYFSLFLWSVIPAFDPAFFQRIAMANNVKQSSRSFIIASVVTFLLGAIVCWIGVLILAIYPNIAADNILKLLISDYVWITGFKGLILAGIMAMVMSTIDSYINSSAVLLTHDLRESLNIRLIKNELFTTRICSMLLGSVAILFAMRSGSFLELFIWVTMFYMPIVTVPFMMAIFGFRSSSKAVLIGMSAGATVAMIWEVFFKVKMGNIGGLIPGMLGNLIFLTASHYLLKQKGGWVGIKDQASFIAKKLQRRQQRRQRLKVLWNDIASFNFIATCKKNTPENEVFISLFGLFIMISTFFSISSIPKEVKMQYASLMDILFLMTLWSSTVLICYPIWSERWKETTFVALCWNAIVFFVLICFSFLMALITNFSAMQLILFMTNVLMVSLLISWRVSLFYLVFGVCVTLFFYESYLMSHQIQSGFSALEFKIAYLILLVSSTLVMFIKPKQEQQEQTEAQVEYLRKEVDYAKREFEDFANGLDFLENKFKEKEGTLKAKEIYLREQLKLRNIEISKLKDLKDEFLRNVTHESNTPLTGVLSLCDILYSYYDKLDEADIKQSIKDIVNSGDRLKTYVNSIVDLSKLSSLTCKIEKKEVALSKIVRDRPVLYKKIFADEIKQQEFNFDIKEDVTVVCDEYYITQAIDNLISNAVKYGQGKPISISLKKTTDNEVQFEIIDQGIGIPKNELFSIFEKFSVSSKTSTPAGGRGVGLALCKSAIESHGGNISVKSDGNKGTRFTFTIPILG